MGTKQLSVHEVIPLLFALQIVELSAIWGRRWSLCVTLRKHAEDVFTLVILSAQVINWYIILFSRSTCHNLIFYLMYFASCQLPPLEQLSLKMSSPEASTHLWDLTEAFTVSSEEYPRSGILKGNGQTSGGLKDPSAHPGKLYPVNSHCRLSPHLWPLPHIQGITQDPSSERPHVWFHTLLSPSWNP